MTDDLITPREAGDLLAGTPASTLAHWRRIGFGPSWVPLGRRVAYSRSAVMAWIAERAELGEQAQRDRAL